MTVADTYTYQSKGYCAGQCSSSSYLATSKGNECLCGNKTPANLVSDSNCNVQCTGYGQEMCGGNGYLSVYSLTGGGGDQVGGSSNSTSSASSAASSISTSSPSSTTAAPSVVYVTTGGVTVTSIAASPTSTPSSSSSSGGSSSKISTGAIAGIVVGVIGAGALAGVGFFFYRRNKRRAQEDGGSTSIYGKSPGSGHQRIPSTGIPPPQNPFKPHDPRLEPEMMQQRYSTGSLADEQDYSRKILRV